jgi:hypothetical protein
MIALLAALALAAASPRAALLAEAGDDARAVAAELDAQPAVTRLGDDDTARLVARASSSGIRCDVTTPECAARVGAFGALDLVVVLRIDAAPAPRATLVLVDCADGREVRRVGARLGDGPSRATGLRALARAVLGGDPPRGTLHVEGAPALQVIVDDVTRGSPPLDVTLPAGTHTVVWRAARDEEARVVDVPVESVVHAAPAALERSSPWTGIGIAGVVLGAALAGGAGIAAVAVAPDEARRDEVTARQYNDAVATGRALLGVSAVGLAVAAASASAWLALGGSDG